MAMTGADIHNNGRCWKAGGQYWICLLLAVVTFAVYWQVRDFEFVSYDDPLYVAANRHVQKGLTLETVVWSFTDATRVTNYWVPLTWLSILLDYELYGRNAGGYHLTNLMLHLLNVVLLFLLLRQMTGAFWRSAFAAALFALHPLHVESVAWVTERKDVLSTFFWMATLIAYGGYVRRPGLGCYLWTLTLFCLGMMAKPMLVTLPFVLLLLDYWPLQRFDTGGGLRMGAARKLIFEKVLFLLIVLAAGVATFLTQQAGGAVKSLASVPFGVRLANVPVAYLTYIAKLLYPVRLAFLYPHSGALPLWQWAGASLFLAIVTFLVLRFSGKRPYLAVGWLWYLGTLVPVIGLVVIGPHVVADRYAYVPLIGLYLLAAWGIPELLPQGRCRRPALAAAASVVLAMLAAATHAQVRTWQNSTSLFEHALEVTDHNVVAYNNLGAVCQQKGKTAEAENLYLQALKIEADNIEALMNLGILWKHLGRVDEARRCFRKVLKIYPEFKDAHFNMALALSDQGKAAQAASHYAAALRIDPSFVQAHNNLGIILEGQGRTAGAIKHYLAAVQTDPEYKEAHLNLGGIFLAQGKLQAAADQYVEVLRIDPSNAQAHNDLGVVLAKQGHIRRAIAHFQTAIQSAPEYLDARSNLEKVLALQVQSKKTSLESQPTGGHHVRHDAGGPERGAAR